MKRAVVDQCRAYLLVASLAAVLLQVAVLAAVLVFDVPQALFTTSVFRLCVMVWVVAAVIVTRKLSGSAYRTAVAGSHISIDSKLKGAVALSSGCPRRALVVLYLRLNPGKLASATA